MGTFVSTGKFETVKLPPVSVYHAHTNKRQLSICMWRHPAKLKRKAINRQLLKRKIPEMVQRCDKSEQNNTPRVHLYRLEPAWIKKVLIFAHYSYR